MSAACPLPSTGTDIAGPVKHRLPSMPIAISPDR
jgi:hypothetical protein